MENVNVQLKDVDYEFGKTSGTDSNGRRWIYEEELWRCEADGRMISADRVDATYATRRYRSRRSITDLQ